MDETIDLIVIPDVFSDTRCVSVPLAGVENAWMAAPRLYAGDAPLNYADLAQFTMLVQGNRSGTGLVYGRWLAEHGVGASRTIPAKAWWRRSALPCRGWGQLSAGAGDGAPAAKRPAAPPAGQGSCRRCAMRSITAPTVTRPSASA